MNTRVEFRSSAFLAYDGESEEINPGRWGKRLAEFLQMKLGEHGIVTDDIYTEDWGVALPIRNDAFPMWIGCGNDEEHPDGFRCFIEPDQPFVRRWFRKIDARPRISEVSAALERILATSPEVRDIRWSGL